MKQIITILLLTLSLKSYSQIWIGNNSDSTYWKNNLSVYHNYQWTGNTWKLQINCDSLLLELQFWKDKYNELLYQSEKIRLQELQKVQLPYQKMPEFNFNNKMLISPRDSFFKIPQDSIIFELNNKQFKIYKKDSTKLDNHIYLIKD